MGHNPTATSASLEENPLDPGTHSGLDNWTVPNIENSRKTLRAGALSNLAGVSTDTLRHYEKLGILKKPPRTPSGYRVYTPEALDRVLLIRNALASGFTLKELVTILCVRDAGGAPCREVASLAHEKVQQLTAQIEQLIRLRDTLRRTAEEWDHRLETARPHDRVNLLESLSSNSTEPTANADGEEDENASSRRNPRASRFCSGPKSDRVPYAQASNGR